MEAVGLQVGLSLFSKCGKRSFSHNGFISRVVIALALFISALILAKASFATEVRKGTICWLATSIA